MATETKRVYDIQVNGADSVNELKDAVTQLTEKLKTLNETSKEYQETLAQLTELQTKLADAMNSIGGNAGKVKDAIKDMNSATSTAKENMEEMGSATERARQQLDNMGDATTIKELKAEISTLKDIIVDLQSEGARGTDEWNEATQRLTEEQKRLKEVSDIARGSWSSVTAATGSYNELVNSMKELKAQWRATNDEAERNRLGADIKAINDQLKAYDYSLGNYQRNVGNYKSAVEGLDGEFSNMRQELKALKEYMQQLDPSTEAYSEAMARAAEITHILSDQQEMVKYSSADIGDQLDNIRGIAANMAAGYSALNAAMGLFGEENEGVKEAMLKVQQAMALVQGLQGLDGMIKRTQGLSNAMKVWISSSKASAAATKANAAASAADAAAKGAEATATAGAVAPQLALNAAMAANPIGVILTAIGALIAIFMIFKDKIKELIGSNKEMSAAFDKVKAVLSGFGNVIKKSVINPIKMAITPIKTLGKVMVDVFTGNWSAIGDDIKAGAEEMKDTVIDTINVVGAFKEGYDKKTAEQNEKARRAEAAARQNELEDIIKDNEARYGSDWKYTEDAKKLYEELFKVRMEQYSEDADEYREAQRDKVSYDREFAEKEKEAAEKAEKEAKKRRDDAMKDLKQKREKLLSDFKTAFEKYMPEWNAIENQINDTFNKWGAKLKDGTTAISMYRDTLIKDYKKTAEEADNIINEMYYNMSKSLWSNIAKQMRDDLDKEFYNMDRETSALVAKIESQFESEKLYLGINLPEDAIRHFNDVFSTQMKNINKELELTGDNIKNFYEKVTGEGTVWAGKTEDEIGKIFPEFQKMLDKRNSLEAAENKLRIENFRSASEVILTQFEKEITAEETNSERRLKIKQSEYEKEKLMAEQMSELTLGTTSNQIEDLKAEAVYMESYYNMQMDMYRKARDKYLEMSNDMRLTAEARENAQREAAKITAQMVEAEVDHQIEMMENQRDFIKSWVNAVKDSVASVSDTLGSLADAWGSIIELEKTEIQQQLENGQISEEEAKRREEENKQSFENLKKLQIAQTIINTLSAAISAYQSMASIPYVGPVLGAAAAAAALATGYANVRQIQATQYGSSSAGGTPSTSSSSTNFQLPNVMDLEPSMGRNVTGQDNIDSLNNSGGNGRGETVIRAFVVESEIGAAQKVAAKRENEITF